MPNSDTVEEIVHAGLCHGCGTCESLCPNKAIKLKLNIKKGIYLPEIAKNSCNNCNICFRVCPGHEVLFQKLNIDIFGKQPQNNLAGHFISCYSGFASDSKIRFASSSGGLVTTLLVYALEKNIIDGVLVTRMNHKSPLEPEPFIARTKEEIIESAKSKYCPVPANIALKYILQTDGKFAVVGLPCHLHGIRKAEQINRKLKEKIIFHLGIFCASEVSFLGTENLLKRLHVSKDSILKLDYRGDGWPGNLIIKTTDPNKNVVMPYGKFNDNIFLSFIPLRCKLCIDHTSELADISFGDAWLPEYTTKDKIGTSFIIARNKIGENILNEALCDKQIEISLISIKKVIKSQGDMVNKKVDVFARMNILNFLGKKVPDYGIKPLRVTLKQYLYAFYSFIQYCVASSKHTWWILEIHCNIIYRTRKIFSSLTRHSSNLKNVKV